VAAEVERQRAHDATEADLGALDRRLAELERRRGNFARSLALFDDEETAAPVRAELRSLAEQAKMLGAERRSLELRSASLDQERRRIADLATWCGRVAENLALLTYAEKWMVLEALGVSVLLYRADHDPRWELTMEPLPVSPAGEGIAYTSTAG
jgi:hypothetical protein